MLLNRVLPEVKKHFPDLKIKFKNESLLMKLMGKLLFFNKGFMTKFTTTVGSTIYFPSKEVLENKKYFVFVTLFHEMVHIWDSKQNKLFKFLYLIPQSLILLLIPLLFICSWKLILPLIILCALPLPAYFRMKYEKRAYFISLYTLYCLGKKFKQHNILNTFKNKYLQHFKSSNYYFMWLFNGLDKEFDEMIIKIERGEKPLNDKIMFIIDDLINLI